MVAYYFPPLGGIGSIRAMKFATHLPEWGWRTSVLAPDTAGLGGDDLPPLLAGSVVRARSFEIGRLANAVVGAGHGRSELSAPIRHELRRFAHRFLYYPDPQVGWYPFALRAARRIARGSRLDAIFSSSVPVTAHLIARRLHRESGVPWVAEFRDPWADVAPSPFSARRDRLERGILREANAIVTVSEAWKDRFVEKGARRAYVITNGFDPADLPAPAPVEGFVVTHLGSFYPGWQDLQAVWNALRRMRSEEPNLAMRIRFVGEAPPSVRREIAAHGLSDVLEVTGNLPQRQALAATQASSVLIASGFHENHPLHRGVIPAKIFEYLGTGLPILYLSPPDTDAARLLSAQPACRVVAAGDTDGVREGLRDLRGQGRVERDIGPLTRQALAGRLAEVLESVCR